MSPVPPRVPDESSDTVPPAPSAESEGGAVSPDAFTGRHVRILGILLGVATLTTFLVTSAGWQAGRYSNVHIVIPTLLTISGPLTGALCRGLQSCCFANSVSMLPWFLPPLLLAFAIQICWRPRTQTGEAVRLAAWGCGWFVWFAGGWLSFAHALS